MVRPNWENQGLPNFLMDDWTAFDEDECSHQETERHNVVCPDKISDLYVLFCLTLWLSEISYVVYVEYH